MIDQLITALSKEVEISAEEIADTIWLALKMQQFQSESVSSGFPLNKEEERGINNQESQPDQQRLPNTSDLEETSTQPPEEQKAGIYPRNQQHTSKSLDLSFKVPDAPSLREPLTYSNFTFSLDTPEGHLPANWDCEGIDGQEAASSCLLISRLLEHDENQQIDYTQLRNLLAENKWREADKETLRVMLKATNREKEGTLDYQAIKNAPCIDLNTIDQLWTNASKQRFGFSIQLKKWQEAGGKSNRETEYKLGNDIGWYVDNKWLSDISKFTFHLSPPVGHLPVEWTFHLGGIFPRKEESVLFSDLANRLLSCNINNLKIEPQISESNIETSQMTHYERLQQILTRVEKGQQTDEDITFLRQLLLAGNRVGWRIQETWISSSQIIVNPTHAPEGHLPWGIMQVVTMDNAALNAFVHGLRNTTKTIMQQDWQKQLLADFMAFGGFLTGDKVDKEEFKRNLEYELSHDQAWWEGGRLEELKVRKLFSLLTAYLNL